MSSAGALRAMVSTSYSLHLFSSLKKTFRSRHMDSKTFSNVILRDLCKLSLSFKIKT